MEWPPSGTGWRQTVQIARKCAWHFTAFSSCLLVFKQKTCSGLIAKAGFSTGWGGPRMWAAFYMNRIRQYETHQSYPHRQIVSVHGRSPDLELHAYSACLPGFPVTLPRFVALTVEWAVPDFHRIPFSCTFVQPWPVWFFCVSKFYMLLMKCQCLFPVFSSVSIILFPLFPGYVFFCFFGNFLSASKKPKWY